MSAVEQATVAPGTRINVWIACGLGIIGILLPMFAFGSLGDWIALASLALPPTAFALMLATPEAFGVTRRGVRSLNILPSLSVMGLIVAANSDTGFLDWRLLLLPTVLCAAIALLLGAGLVGRRLPGSLWVSALFWAAFGGAYGYGAAIYADTRFDHDQTQVFPATVDRHYLSYHRNSATPHLVLGAWGPVTGESDVAVTQAAYDNLPPGQMACVTLHPGRLSMPWFQAGICNPGN